MTRTKSRLDRQRSSLKSRTRILIVDDHELLRNGLKELLGNEPDLEVCGEAEDETEALRRIADSQPDFVIVDLGLRESQGLDLIKRIRAKDSSPQVVVLSMYEERLYAERVLRAGAMGYVNKQQPSRTIIDAIRQVRDGKPYLSPEFTIRMLQRLRGASGAAEGGLISELSDRELDVFRLIGQGCTTRQVAQRLHLSLSTIETYRERLKTKLNLESGTALTHLATQWVLENT